MAEPTPPDWIGPALGAAGTGIAAFLAWLGVRFTARHNPAVDPQDAINDGFSGLLEQMRKELIAASRERNSFKQMLEEERKAWALERNELLGRISQLEAVAEGFERLLRRLNPGVLPERRAYDPEVDPKHEPILMVEATLRQEGLDDG